MRQSLFVFSEIALIAGLVCSIVLIAGLVCCAGPPERELTEAQRAVEQARAVEADVYAADTLRQATNSLASAQIEIEGEAEKSVFSRSYDEAKQLLASAKHAANRAFYEANSGREMARESANDAIREAHNTLARAKASVLRASGNTGNQGSADDIDVLQIELGRLEATLADAEKELERGNYREARDQAESVVAEARILGKDVARAVKKST